MISIEQANNLIDLVRKMRKVQKQEAKLRKAGEYHRANAIHDNVILLQRSVDQLLNTLL